MLNVNIKKKNDLWCRMLDDQGRTKLKKCCFYWSRMCVMCMPWKLEEKFMIKWNDKVAQSGHEEGGGFFTTLVEWCRAIESEETRCRVWRVWREQQYCLVIWGSGTEEKMGGSRDGTVELLFRSEQDEQDVGFRTLEWQWMSGHNGLTETVVRVHRMMGWRGRSCRSIHCWRADWKTWQAEGLGEEQRRGFWT